jgi:hypothetical protein
MDGQGDGIYVAGDRDAVPPECLLKAISFRAKGSSGAMY